MDCVEGAARREGAPPVKSAVISSHFESISRSNGNKGEGGVNAKGEPRSGISDPLQSDIK